MKPVGRPVAKHRFLTKLLITFSAILILFSIVIVALFNAYISQRTVRSAETESVRALSTLNSAVANEIQTAKRFISSLYDSESYSELPKALSAPAPDTIAGRMQFHRTIEDYFKYCMNTNRDILNIAIITADGEAYVQNRNTSGKPTNYATFLKPRLEKAKDSLRTYGPTLLPGYFMGGVETNPFVLPIYSRIKGSDMRSDVGYLMIEISAAAISSQLPSLGEGNIRPQMMIFSEDGTVYFRTGSGALPDFAEDPASLLANKNRFLRMNGVCHRLEYDPETELYYLCTFPSSEMDERIAAQRSRIILITSAFALAAIAICALFARHYYRRIDAICDTIAEISDGNLERRIRTDNTNDDIRALAEDINLLTDRLREHIDVAYQMGIESRNSELLRKDAELKLANAELYALQTQINPHFLHNTLESIRMRAVACDNHDVARMVYILSVLFKYSLKKDYIVSIHEELDMCRLYLELTQIRYPGLVEAVFAVDEGLETYGVPRHVLQPILENTLRHGLRSKNDPCRIDVRITRDGRNLLIEIRDNGRSIPPEQLAQIRESLLDETLPEAAKIGLRNVHLRLKRLFGSEYGLEIDSVLNEGTQVRIRLIAMEEEEMRQYVQSFNRG